MSFEAETLSARSRWRRQLRLWRALAVIAILALIFSLLSKNQNFKNLIGNEKIARLSVANFISDNQLLSKKFKEINNNDNIKAVILIIDSPGGTSFGGEFIYRNLRKISKNGKPTVAIIRTLGTSAAYLVALGSDRIFALETSLIGSIGAIMISANASELLDKVGIETEVYRSGKNKSIPSFVEKTPEKSKELIQESINKVRDYFINTLKKRRSLSQSEIEYVSDGKVFSGNEALKIKLIDEIGGEQEAIDWLEKKRGIKPNLPVINIDYIEKTNNFLDLLLSVTKKTLESSFLTVDGFLSFWHPIDN
ncbi:signal peptide peptidase SppA [Alphaproteobacteria bacterium]|nr:signal peptide peptidase SppA [Alphaproteobacteria bacterium]